MSPLKTDRHDRTQAGRVAPRLLLLGAATMAGSYALLEALLG